MKMRLLLLGTLLFLLSAGKGSSAPPLPVSFSRQILPFLQSDCFSCHGGMNPSSGYSMVNREALLKGGRHGAAITVGKGAQSSLVRYLTGAIKPQMPPGIAWDMERIALVRRWIDEGAKVDSYTPTLKVQKRGNDAIKQTQRFIEANLPSPVTALAYSPKGDLIAVGGYKAVRLLEPNTGRLVKAVLGAKSQVMAVGWSSDGNLLAIGGGEEGVSGEVLVVDTHTWQVVWRLPGHTEVVYTLAWKPNTHELATGSLDKSLRIWDADRGACTKTLKDHADYLSCIAYSKDGKMFASASADRSVKVYDPQSWKRLFTLNAHNDAVNWVAFHPNGKLLATASMDKTIRIWTIKPGGMENPERTLYESEAINTCEFSPKGDRFVYGSFNHKVKVYNAEGTQQQKELQEPQDWVYCVSVSPDGLTVVAGTLDGKVYFWSANDGKLLQTYALPVRRGVKVPLP